MAELNGPSRSLPDTPGPWGFISGRGVLEYDQAEEESRAAALASALMDEIEGSALGRLFDG